ncbi:MAG: FKBP-type peptidyl-prolyl cis-trans isomerase [Bacteroidales bacterium]|jgi:FKBP-type peptidyl-prolyl cis-trans isomerase FklB|nr:FKBP-type peptidyl-prolyl cis-trans isomerase [Bacteroidales bacterium]
MKKTLSFLAVAVCGVAVLASCNNAKTVKLPGITKSQIDSVSYAVGVSFGGMLKSSNLECVDLNIVKKGITDYFAAADGGKPTKIKEQEVGRIIQSFAMKAQVETGKIKKAEEKKFFDKNKQNDSVKVTESGVQYVIERKGDGVKPGPKDTVEVNYEGKLLNGKVFDSSYERKKSVTFPLNRVIKGWGEGLQLCEEGGKIRLWIPFDLGYGSRPMGQDLPAFSTLDFSVEILKVKPYVEKPAKKVAGRHSSAKPTARVKVRK